MNILNIYLYFPHFLHPNDLFYYETYKYFYYKYYKYFYYKTYKYLIF